MKTNLPRLAIALIFASAIISLTCLFHGGTYNSEAERQALYTSNAELPLGGLFAAGFTRTLTVLGGVNFPSAGVEDSLDESLSDLFPIGGALLPPPPSLDDTGYALSFAFGRRHSRKLRSEIEIAFRSNDINQVLDFGSSAREESDGNVSAISALKNFIFEFENESRFTPYLGVGIGVSYIDVQFGEATSIDGEATSQDGESAFTYQAIGGVSTRLNSFAELVVEYRFLGTSELDFGSLNAPFNYNTSALFLGAKFEY